MLLEKLLENIQIISVTGETKLDIKNICYDSRKVEKNSIFICIKGFENDGHLFVRDAIKKGATVIVAEAGQKEQMGTVLACLGTQGDGSFVSVQSQSDRTQKNRPLVFLEPSPCVSSLPTVVYVKDTRKAMAELSNNFYDFPSRKLKIIGITGTNGKTSVTYMLRDILEENGNNVGVIGTISYATGKAKKNAQRTTPESLDLNRLINDMVVNNIDSCVMEVSSHALELERVWGINFDVAVFTNLSPDHLDFHGNIENYKKAKKKLFIKTNQVNVINVDDKVGKEIIKEFDELSTPILTYGMDNVANIYASNIKLTNVAVEFELRTPTFQAAIVINTPGLFTVYNALAAVASAYALNIPKLSIVTGINNFKGVPGRFMRLKEFKDFSVIIDYAHTPDGLLNVLTTIQGFKKNRIITVFGCGGDRDKEKRGVMGKLAGELSDFTIITSDNPRSEKPELIASMIEEGTKKATDFYKIILNRKEAIRHALKHAGKGDTILIAGKGHETTQTFADKTFHFDDAETAISLGRDEGII